MKKQLKNKKSQKSIIGAPIEEKIREIKGVDKMREGGKVSIHSFQ